MEKTSTQITITVYGAGYVGLVTAACFAKLNYQVLCIDVDEHKIAELNQGRVPIYEPGLTELLHEATAKQYLHFSTDVEAGAKFGFYQFIAVGTPPMPDGSADLQYVFNVAKAVAQYRNEACIIINKSTVPVGTVDKVKETIQANLSELGRQLEFAVVSNPEFLKEGSAIHDFMQPDRIVVGAEDEQVIDHMRQLYSPFIDQGFKFLSMDVRSAELTKYAANAMLATKISFMNEISQIAERLGADIELVKLGMSMDSRIGPHFINPGCGYGGSCFPKDIKALSSTARQLGYEPLVLAAVDKVNFAQKQLLFSKIAKYFSGKLSDKVIAVWGLAFKPNTNDIREAPSLVLIEALLAAGAKVQVYDPVAMQEAKQVLGLSSQLKFCSNAQSAIQNADGLAIVTEWSEFRSFAPEIIKQQLKHPVIFDGRNIFDSHLLEELDIKYFGIGRGERL